VVIVLFPFLLRVGRWWCELGEVNVVELLLEQAFPFGSEESQVVEAGAGWWRRGDGVGFDVGVGGGDDAVGFGQLEEGVLEPDLDAGEVKRIIAELDGLTTEIGGDAVAVAAEGEGGGFGDLALVAVEEGVAEFGGVQGAGGGGWVLAVAFEGGLGGFGVKFAMVDDLEPGQEGLVELREGGDGGVLEFGQEVGLNELEEAFNLASAFGVVGCAQDTLNAQGGADGVELFGGVDFALVLKQSSRRGSCSFQ
jgi:hypothetical protein